MATVTKGLVALSAVSFILAVISALSGPIMDVAPVSFSRGCTNLALLGIGVAMVFGEKPAH